jgi:hypothetical protein
MQRIDVKSSLLQAIGYDEASKTLLIEFKGKTEGEPGKVYKYNGVSQETFEKFRTAESHGKHFLKEIKPNHACTKVEPEKPDAEDEKKASQARKPFKTATDDENCPF